MRIPGGLYLKILAAFMAALALCLVLVAVLFRYTAGDGFLDRFRNFAAAQSLVVKELVQNQINSRPRVPLPQNIRLKKTIERLARTYEATVWLEEPNGRIPFHFSGVKDQNLPPRRMTQVEWENSIVINGIRVFHHPHFAKGVYLIIPIDIGEAEAARLHALFPEPPRQDEHRFLIGLLGLGLVVAGICLPLSRYITHPVKSLEFSAKRIAAGDISHRARVRSGDEIGSLASAFNAMTDKLEDMIRSGKELTANVSHELRTPLARIRIATELMQRELDRPDDIKRRLSSIEADVEDMDRLLEQLLGYSKLDMRRPEQADQPVDLGRLLREQLIRFGPLLEKKEIELKADRIDPIEIMGLEAELKTAVSNILDNAAKYTPKGGTLRVGLKLEKGRALLTAVNTHPPIKEKNLAEIFDPFARAGRTGYTGAGLGLAIVKKIASRLKGEARAENTPEGFKMTLDLPARPPSSAAFRPGRCPAP